MTMRQTMTIAAVGAALAVAGCGGDDASTNAAAPGPGGYGMPGGRPGGGLDPATLAKALGVSQAKVKTALAKIMPRGGRPSGGAPPSGTPGAQGTPPAGQAPPNGTLPPGGRPGGAFRGQLAKQLAKELGVSESKVEKALQPMSQRPAGGSSQ